MRIAFQDSNGLWHHPVQVFEDKEQVDAFLSDLPVLWEFKDVAGYHCYVNVNHIVRLSLEEE